MKKFLVALVALCSLLTVACAPQGTTTVDLVPSMEQSATLTPDECGMLFMYILENDGITEMSGMIVVTPETYRLLDSMDRGDQEAFLSWLQTAAEYFYVNDNEEGLLLVGTIGNALRHAIEN